LISDRTFDRKFFNKSLKRLLKNRSVRVKDKKFYLSGVKPVSWELRKKYTRETLRKNKKELDTLSKIPWVKMIGITGSLAAYNGEKGSDTDILIVANKNRIWLTRGFLILMLIILGKYPNRRSKKLKICPNIYLDEDKMEWVKEKQNIYSAHEVLMLQPYYEKDHTYFKFLKQNEWAFRYFMNCSIELPKRFKRERTGENKLIDLLEGLARYMEIKFMRGITTEKIKKDFIHFNKNDKMPNIIKQYRQLIKRI
jgi:predicted nucleotidyltransferase